MAAGDPDEQTKQKEMANAPIVVTERDIVFNCEHCGGELVVDREGAGLEVSCSLCGHGLVIPPYQPRPTSEVAPAPAEVPQRFDFTGFSASQLGRRLEELKNQLKENRSQETELRGHVNRATIELHRLQLKLQKLQERFREIDAEMTAARAQLPQV